MRVSLIAAAAENHVIGRDNDLPWDLPDDLQYFKDTTKGKPIIMGRKNYESIGRPLPKRRNIIITRQPDYRVDGCDVVGSLGEAMELAQQADAEEMFVIGGGEIYRQALPLADRVYLTRVHADVEGDVYFPELGEDWREVSSEYHPADERHKHAFTFLVYERR